MAGSLHEALHTFMIISRSVLVRVRNISNILCRENQNKRFVFNNVLSKIVPFKR